MYSATYKQIKYAKAISDRTGIALPLHNDFYEYKKWIAENKDKPDVLEIAVNDKNFGEGQIILSFRKVPENCSECYLYKNNSFYDEDAFFGDGVLHYCPFGCSVWGCHVERPSDCPIIKKEI